MIQGICLASGLTTKARKHKDKEVKSEKCEVKSAENQDVLHSSLLTMHYLLCNLGVLVVDLEDMIGKYNSR